MDFGFLSWGESNDSSRRHFAAIQLKYMWGHFIHKEQYGSRAHTEGAGVAWGDEFWHTFGIGDEFYRLSITEREKTPQPVKDQSFLQIVASNLPMKN